MSPGAQRGRGSGVPGWSLAFRGDETPEGVRVGSLSFAPCPGAVDKHFILIGYPLYALFDGGVGVPLLEKEGGNLYPRGERS